MSLVTSRCRDNIATLQYCEDSLSLVYKQKWLWGYIAALLETQQITNDEYDEFYNMIYEWSFNTASK